MFRYYTKLGAKLVELVQLMQKFVPRSRIKIIHIEPTQSTLLDPKLMFWCISYHLAALATIRLPYKTRGKTFRTSAKVCAKEVAFEFFTTKAPDPPHLILNCCFGALRTIWCIRDRLVALRNSEENGPN